MYRVVLFAIVIVFFIVGCTSTVTKKVEIIDKPLPLTFPLIENELKDGKTYEIDIKKYPMIVTSTHLLEKKGGIHLYQGKELQRNYLDQLIPSSKSYEKHKKEFRNKTIFVIKSDEKYPSSIDFLSDENYDVRISDIVKNKKIIGKVFKTKHGVLFVPDNILKFERNEKYLREKYPKNVGGDIKVTGFNILNFFTTLNDENISSSVSNKPRGANNKIEFDKQKEKLLTTLDRIDSDIYGFIEVENNGFSKDSAIANLVFSLNKYINGKREYDYIKFNQKIADGLITLALVYDTKVLREIGTAFTLPEDEISYELNNDSNKVNFSRSPIFKEFEVIKNNFRFVVGVNHFKSKSSRNASGANLDQKDGQGAYSKKRTKQAKRLVKFYKNNLQDKKVLMIGDYNAYKDSTAIKEIKKEFYDLAESKVVDENFFSYSYNGEIGYLDYAFANEQMINYISAIDSWNINSLENKYLDYDIYSKGNPESCTEDTKNEVVCLSKTRGYKLFDGNTPFRSSDHDPIIIGIKTK